MILDGPNRTGTVLKQSQTLITIQFKPKLVTFSAPQKPNPRQSHPTSSQSRLNAAIHLHMTVICHNSPLNSNIFPPFACIFPPFTIEFQKITAIKPSVIIKSFHLRQNGRQSHPTSSQARSFAASCDLLASVAIICRHSLRQGSICNDLPPVAP